MEARDAAAQQRPGEPVVTPRSGTLVDAEIDELPAPEPTRVGSRRQLAYLGLCLVLIGLNLRTVFSSFSAVLPEVSSQVPLPAWAVAVLTTVPVTLLGVFAPLAPVLARRFGAERVLLGAMAVLTGGSCRDRRNWECREPVAICPPSLPGRRPAGLRSPCATSCSPDWSSATSRTGSASWAGCTPRPSARPRHSAPASPTRSTPLRVSGPWPCGSGRCPPPSYFSCSSPWRSASAPCGTSPFGAA